MRRGCRGPRIDPEAFGRFSERIARFLGTARFLVCMTVVVIWLDRLEHRSAPDDLRFDPYPFIFLTLMLCRCRRPTPPR